MTAMAEGYEALRRQATGASGATGDGALSATPRGLALLLRSGVGAWMAVWRQLVGGAPSGGAPSGGAPSAALAAASEPSVVERAESRVTALRLGPELAVLLVEMALSGQSGHRGERRIAS
ncbi:MAG: hypothetical protein ACRDI2_13190 [Chloroflexota bacterium]